MTNKPKQVSDKLIDYDPASALVNDEEMAFFVTDAFETGDARHIASALGVAARAKGMTRVAKQTGLSREQLYRSLSMDGNPTLKTILAVMRAIDMELAARPADKKNPTRV